MSFRSVVLKIMAALGLVVGIEMIIGGIAGFKEEPFKSENISNIDVSLVEDYNYICFDEIEILERYAFRTKRVETDSEGTKTGTYYYVYDSSQPMDNNRLDAEYFVVRFCDKNGEEYVTSLWVPAGKTYSPHLSSGKTQMCVAPYSSGGSSDHKVKLLQLESAAVSRYTTEEGIKRASFSLEYKGATVEQYQKTENKLETRQNIVTIIFGAVLVLVCIFQLCKKEKYWNDRNEAAEQAQGDLKKPVSYGVWVCQTCGMENSTQYSQCKKCGKYKGM